MLSNLNRKLEVISQPLTSEWNKSDFHQVPLNLIKWIGIKTSNFNIKLLMALTEFIEKRMFSLLKAPLQVGFWSLS